MAELLQGTPVDAGSNPARERCAASAAQATDWDQISTKFTAVRGVGYVTWYPIATEATSFAEGNSVAERLGRWKEREFGSTMHLQIAVTADEGDAPVET